MEGRVGWLCPKLTNLSPCPRPLPHPRTMSARQEIQKSRISFRIFPTACISHHIGGGVTEPIFCKQIAPTRIRSVQYIHILSTSMSRQQELRNIYISHLHHLKPEHWTRHCPQSNICQISFSALVGGLGGKEQKLLGNFEDWFYFGPLSPPLLPFTVAKKGEERARKTQIGHFMSISAKRETTWCSFNWQPTRSFTQWFNNRLKFLK